MPLHLFSTLSIAPMIDWTYTHFRVFMRLLAPNALLYTDMQTVGSVLNNPIRALEFHAIEHPLALQLGGNDANKLADCALLAQKKGFVEVNLNLGCPSDRVLSGHFGACLMSQPRQVANCIQNMKDKVDIAITAKTRIGIDNQDSYEFFGSFVNTLMDAGCDKLIVHARKAWLHGLNPKQNRTIPPLHYDYVYRIKQEFPSKAIVINGNIQNIEEINHHLHHVDGVMLGRLACQNPYAIAQIHHDLYPSVELKTRSQILQTYLDYVCEKCRVGVPLSLLLKPILNLAHSLPGARAWREKVTQVQRGNRAEELPHILMLLEEMELAKTADVIS